MKDEWGISKNTINPPDEALTFYRNVLTEVLALFPSEYVHIGGDEAPKDQWEERRFALQRIEQLGLEDVQSWLIQQVEYRAFPRAAALAELLWSPVVQHNFYDFNQRLSTHLTRLGVG